MKHQVLRVISRLAEDVGTPRALAVKLLAESGEWAELQQLRCRPQDYLDSESYWRDNLITEILRKCDLPTTVDKEAAAVQTFLSCEAQNCATNARLSRYLPDSLLLEAEDVPVYDFICLWRKEVSYVFGNLPDHLHPRFSGGATYADTGLQTTIPDKMSSAPTVYSPCRDILPLWGETSWSRALVRDRPWFSDPLTVRGNIFFTVPKDGTKFRGCAKEASIPITYQLAVGHLLKSRLSRIGIDLQTGKATHMSLAMEASAVGNFATIDMSNASDTMCRVLVQLLVRGDWYALLDSLRAHMTRMDGKWFRLEKFSSMGNGFTFELETIIFATLARVVVREEGGDPDLVKCYGDDLIVPVDHYRSVVAALRLFGFEPNMKKTFAEGPFRESCGGDFWDGIPVRAHYLEELPDEPQQWISLANGLRRVADANGSNVPRWNIVRRAWLCALDPIPGNIRRCRGPKTLGDIVIHDEPEFWTNASKPPRFRTETVGYSRVIGPHKTDLAEDWHPTWDDQYILAYVPAPSVLPWHHWLPSVQLASCTLGIPSQGVTPREGIQGYRIRPVSARLTSSWLPTPRHIA
jgi:hypothetical protein